MFLINKLGGTTLAGINFHRKLRVKPQETKTNLCRQIVALVFQMCRVDVTKR